VPQSIDGSSDAKTQWKLAAPVFPMLVGLGFIGAGFNDSNVSNDSLLRTLGFVFLVGGLILLFVIARSLLPTTARAALPMAMTWVTLGWVGAAVVMAWSVSGGDDTSSGLMGGFSLLIGIGAVVTFVRKVGLDSGAAE